MENRSWKDQAEACRKALELVKAADWNAVERLTERACEQYPDSLALVGTRMNALYSLGRADGAAELGVGYVKRFSNADKIIRNLLAVLPKLSRIEPSWLPVFEKLPSEDGQVLYIKVLVRCKRGVDAKVAFERLNLTFPQQHLLSSAEFVTILVAEDLLENALEELASKPKYELPDTTEIKNLIELFLKLSLQNQPERFGEAKQLAEMLEAKYPDSPDAWFALGRVWWDASRMDRSLPYLRRFLEKFPKNSIRTGVTFNSIYDESVDQIELFELHRSLAKLKEEGLSGSFAATNIDFDKNRKLRVGYVSPDFGRHPVGYYAITTIPFHNSNQFETFLYSHRDPLVQDDVLSKEFRASVGEDHWRWTFKLGPKQLLDQIRKDKIDILVDLAGHTTGNRMDVFGMRAAPVQVTWLGYPHSTGMRAMDYRISDEIVEPRGESDRLSSEKIIRLPNGFHSIRMPDELPEPSVPPCLKNGYITFGSFNNVNKIGIHTIGLWASLMKGIPNSRLLLKHRTMNTFENREGIRSLFAFYGVDPDRLKFVGTTPGREQHFSMYSQMDIALDPIGYNGTTTTCEALYMGVPVLTLPGRKHAARVSASLLHRIGLNGWVAKDKEHYLKIAKYASMNFEVLEKRRARLRQDFLNSPLNDGQGLAKDLENAFRDMWYQICDPSPPNSTPNN